MNFSPLPPAVSRAQINHILSTFDFARVEMAMKAMDWKWTHAPEPDAVPDVDRLRKCAVELLEWAASSDGGYISTGGFVAERREDGALTLQFEIARGSAEPNVSDNEEWNPL